MVKRVRHIVLPRLKSDAGLPLRAKDRFVPQSGHHPPPLPIAFARRAAYLGTRHDDPDGEAFA